MKLVECVPNFSEGRNREVIDSIRKAAERIDGVTVLDCESDPNHNRMVLTFVGPPEAVKEAALASSGQAVNLIDLRTHKGEHPRMGAVDVVPFVPLREVTMDNCVTLANEFATEYAKRFGVPVFLYEQAAKRSERKDLARVREGQYEGLRELIGKDASRDPDYGPSRIHESAGATAVGARPILIAYNVNLETKDLSIAKKIAHLVRGRDGGLPSVKALGFELRDRSLVQVSMNLTDYKVSSISNAFEAVSKHAENLRVKVFESEIVGLVPLDALTGAAISYLKLTNFVPNQIIENRLFEIASEMGVRGMKGSSPEQVDFSRMTVQEFVTCVASKEPVPGGGTVSAVAGSLAASLIAMVCRLTIGKKGYESVSKRAEEILSMVNEIQTIFLNLGNKDSDAYSKVSEALSLPKSTEEERSQRKKRLVLALRGATEVPWATFLESLKILKASREVLALGSKNTKSDAETALELSKAAAKGALSNIRINLESLSSLDPEYVSEKSAIMEPLISELNAQLREE